MLDSTDHDRFMELALREAANAPAHGDVPVGAVIVDSAGRLVAANHNRREERGDPTAHAEVLVLAEAAHRAGSWRLLGHTLYVTLEPCSMCAGGRGLRPNRPDRVRRRRPQSRSGVEPPTTFPAIGVSTTSAR